ncbi:MAG: hypothetical protein ACRD0G_06105 [Acidimicrobiales bacterium]
MSENEASPDPSTTPQPPAPGARVRPRLVVAIVVAAVMLLGIVGLIGVAVFGGDDDPTGAGLDRRVNVDNPATAPPASAPAAGTGAAAPDLPESTDPQGDSGEGVVDTGPSPVTTAVAVDAIESPGDDQQLPAPGSDPVQFPAFVTNPAPPSTYAAIPLAELEPGDVPELQGWSVTSRGDDHVTFAGGDAVVDVFVYGEAINADAALDRFYADVRADLAEVTASPVARLGAPSSRFVYVAGSQFVATDAEQHGTVAISGSVIAAVGTDGHVVVIAVSRDGRSTADQLAADGELLRAILARL